ncbi:hypothetical protein CPC08DRAFT_741049 [Agrocybe pediades]|nr:hypothetical protein CPC08DRAFT_741049 [Agrocybe pediades]
MTQDYKPTYAEVAKSVPDDGDIDESFIGVHHEEEEWEDEEEEKMSASYASTYAEVTKSPPVRRRRKGAAARAVNRESRQSSATPSTPNRKATRPPPKAQERPIIVQEDVMDGAVNGALFVGRYALDLLSGTMLLGLYLLAVLTSQVSYTLQKAFSPVCVLPGMSRLQMCGGGRHAQKAVGKRSQWADYPSLMDQQSKTFEQLMGDTVGGSALSLEIKHAEMATTDLVTLVRISDLKAKDSLASSLTSFVDDAKKTGRGLQKLTSKIGGAVDNIMAVNDYALHSIEEARANKPSILSALVPWGPARKNVNEVVTRTFEEAMDVLSNNMQRLIVEAENSLQNLNNLEERLATIHDIIMREDFALTNEKEDVLAELWTFFGVNNKKLRGFDDHLRMLKELKEYRKQALVHVVAALQTLRGMNEDMEDMRERVAAPDLTGSTVPVEVHMKSIKMGLERMKEGRVRAQRLEEEAIRKEKGIEARRA